MPTPYYDHAGITIYHGDCREVLPGLASVDLLLTDPPYGIGSWSSTGGNSLRQEECDAINRWDSAPDADVLLACVGKATMSIVWGGNYLCGVLGAFRSPLLWDKRIRGMHFADGELAWTNFDFGSLRILELPAAASDARGAREHPTQKPVQLMRWCISQCKPEARTILDPFMGSGTTLRAAKDLGRRAIGIEIEEKYCEIAAKRMMQEVLFPAVEAP